MVERIATTTKGMQRINPGGGTSSADARIVQVDVMFDDTANAPQVLGREARVVFLEWE
jgi:hypothetical protein